MQSCKWVAAALISATCVSIASADEVHYVERDGVTYRETRRTVQSHMPVTRYEQREQTVYREQLVPQTQQTYNTVFTPVTEYHCVTRLRSRWNPFVQPYLAQEMMPVRRWETRQQVVHTPVYARQLLPEKRIVQVPVTTTHVAEQEYITRVPVGPTSGVGGIARLESDPPRQSSGWQAPGSVIRR